MGTSYCRALRSTLASNITSNNFSPTGQSLLAEPDRSRSVSVPSEPSENLLQRESYVYRENISQDKAEEHPIHDSVASFGSSSATAASSRPQEPTSTRAKSPQQTLVPTFLPTSSDELHDHLVYIINFRLAENLQKLVAYHQLHRRYASTRTYNLLISQALRLSSLRHVRILFGQMKHDGTPLDEHSDILQIRYLVRTGKWKTAMDAVGHKYGFGQDSLPASLWKELLGVPAKGADTSGHIDHETGKKVITKREISTFPDSDALTFIRGAPYRKFSSSLVHAIVRRLLASDQAEAAQSVTHSFILSQFENIHQRHFQQILSLIHLHLRTDLNPEAPLKFSEAQRRLQFFLGCHSGIRPNGATLYYLLRTLDGRKHRGFRSFKASREFVARWGSAMETSDVRRQVAMYAKADNLVTIVQLMVKREDDALAQEIEVPIPSFLEAKESGRVQERLPFSQLFRSRERQRLQWVPIRRWLAQQQKHDGTRI